MMREIANKVILCSNSEYGLKAAVDRLIRTQNYATVFDVQLGILKGIREDTFELNNGFDYKYAYIIPGMPKVYCASMLDGYAGPEVLVSNSLLALLVYCNQSLFVKTDEVHDVFKGNVLDVSTQGYNINSTCGNFKYAIPVHTIQSEGDKQMETTNTGIEAIIQMKIMESVIGNDDIDIGKLFMLQQLTSGKRLDITDAIKAKMMSKFKLDGDMDKMSINQLMTLQMLQDNTFDISKLIQIKLMEKLLND